MTEEVRRCGVKLIIIINLIIKIITAVVHSASYPPGKANQVAAYQW